MSSFFHTYRMEDDKQVLGVFAMAFIHNVSYYLTHISIYQDGMIDCWELVDFETFKQKVRTGWVVTRPPEGAEIDVSFLGCFKAVGARFWIEPEEFIKEVQDEIEELNGRPTASDRCRAAWEAYQQTPSDAMKEALRVAYEAIPSHNRVYVLHDMDSKDLPIQYALYGQPDDTNPNA